MFSAFCPSAFILPAVIHQFLYFHFFKNPVLLEKAEYKHKKKAQDCQTNCRELKGQVHIIGSVKHFKNHLAKCQIKDISQQNACCQRRTADQKLFNEKKAAHGRTLHPHGHITGKFPASLLKDKMSDVSDQPSQNQHHHHRHAYENGHHRPHQLAEGIYGIGKQQGVIGKDQGDAQDKGQHIDGIVPHTPFYISYSQFSVHGQHHRLTWTSHPGFPGRMLFCLFSPSASL